MAKPALLITRRVPPDVEARAVRDYDARLNPDDLPRSWADLVRLAQGGGYTVLPGRAARCRHDRCLAGLCARYRHL